MGMSKLRAAAKGAKTTTKKSSTPSVTVSEAVGEAIVAFQAAKKKEKEAKAEIALAEIDLTPESARLRLEQCESDNKVHASVRLVSGDKNLLFTQKGQFKKMEGDAEDPIRAIVGEDSFKQYFDVKTTYSLDEEALERLSATDPGVEKALSEFVDALGANAERILTATTLVVPNERFVRDSIFEHDTKKLAERLESEGFAVPYKPSYR